MTPEDSPKGPKRHRARFQVWCAEDLVSAIYGADADSDALYEYMRAVDERIMNGEDVADPYITIEWDESP